jgi:hypothetical protein
MAHYASIVNKSALDVCEGLRKADVCAQAMLAAGMPAFAVSLLNTFLKGRSCLQAFQVPQTLFPQTAFLP